MLPKFAFLWINRSDRLWAGGYLLLLLGGCGAAGWLLAGFGAPGLVWLGTLGVVAHLVAAETDAIALASAWVMAIVAGGVVGKAWIPLWDSRVPHENAQRWAMVLWLLWLGAIGLVVLLARARRMLRGLGWRDRQAARAIGLLAWAALGVGWFIYQRMS